MNENIGNKKGDCRTGCDSQKEKNKHDAGDKKSHDYQKKDKKKESSDRKAEKTPGKQA
jgi:hypothetical protein